MMCTQYNFTVTSHSTSGRYEIDIIAECKRWQLSAGERQATTHMPTRDSTEPLKEGFLANTLTWIDQVEQAEE